MNQQKLSGTRIYNIWRAMNRRCTDPRHDAYKYYGGRGIVVCEEWRQSFLAFHSWAIANGYDDDLTIDRIDSDGNYSPENCTWLSMTEQNRRHRNCIALTYNGVTQLAIDWARQFGIKFSTFYWKLHRGETIEQIVCGIGR